MDSQSTIGPHYVSMLQLCNPSSVGQQICKLVLCPLVLEICGLAAIGQC